MDLKYFGIIGSLIDLAYLFGLISGVVKISGENFITSPAVVFSLTAFVLVWGIYAIVYTLLVKIGKRMGRMHRYQAERLSFFFGAPFFFFWSLALARVLVLGKFFGDAIAPYALSFGLGIVLCFITATFAWEVVNVFLDMR